MSLSGSVGADVVDAAQEVIEDEIRISEDVNVETAFRRRANLMRSPPKFLEGAHVSAVRLAGRSSRGSTHQQ